jgi:hypothetical protein
VRDGTAALKRFVYEHPADRSGHCEHKMDVNLGFKFGTGERRGEL